MPAIAPDRALWGGAAFGPGFGCAGRLGAAAAAGACPAAFSAVSATITRSTPGIARTASSARLRIGSSVWARSAGTVMEKATRPSDT